MCVDPKLSDKRLRRRKLERKFRRIRRNVGERFASVREWTDVRPRLATKAANEDILEGAGLLRSVSREPQAFTTSRRLAREAADERAKQDAEDARKFAERFPYAYHAAA